MLKAPSCVLSNRRVATPSLLRQENVALRRLVDLPGTRSPPQSHHTASARTPAPATTSSNGGTYHYRRPGLGSSPGSTVGESHSLASSAMGSGRVQVPSPAGAAYLDASLRALRSSQTGTLPLSFPPPVPVRSLHSSSRHGTQHGHTHLHLQYHLHRCRRPLPLARLPAHPQAHRAEFTFLLPLLLHRRLLL